MLSLIIDVVVKYWVQFFCAGIVSGIGLIYKKINAERKAGQEKFYSQLETSLAQKIDSVIEISEGDDLRLQKQIDDLDNHMDTLAKGILSLQGREFKQECRNLLADDHTLTLEEFEDLEAEHEIYNRLGGNHNGDSLFELVKKKAVHIVD